MRKLVYGLCVFRKIIHELKRVDCRPYIRIHLIIIYLLHYFVHYEIFDVEYWNIVIIGRSCSSAGRGFGSILLSDQTKVEY